MADAALVASATLIVNDNTPSFQPLYRQIQDRLLRSLQAGEWRAGELIPSEIELAARFKVSQGTVRKAVDELAAGNLLVRRQGRGTFVATHAEETTQYRFLRLMPDEGTPPGMTRRLIDCRRLRAPRDVARALALEPGEAAFELRRLLLASGASSPGGKAVVYDDIWLPGNLFKGLSIGKLEAWRGPMYELLESEFGVHMTRAEEKLRAVAAGPDEAGQLGLPEGTPLLSVERLSFTYGDRPVELRRGLYHTASHHYRNVLA